MSSWANSAVFVTETNDEGSCACQLAGRSQSGVNDLRVALKKLRCRHVVSAPARQLDAPIGSPVQA